MLQKMDTLLLRRVGVSTNLRIKGHIFLVCHYIALYYMIINGVQKLPLRWRQEEALLALR